MSKRLPDKPSELLLLALGDLEKVEADPRYEVDMGRWHSPNGVCKVCLAGSVIAGTLGVPSNKWSAPAVFGEITRRKLLALNAFREGWISGELGALDYMRIPCPEALEEYSDEVDVANYADHPETFKQDMLSLVGILQAEGL